MSDNLRAAKASIQAEIAHTKAGIAHYTGRLSALEASLAGLVGIGQGQSTAKASKKAVVAPAASAAPSVKPAAKGKNAKAKKAGAGLPPTGGDFWPSLITDQPRSSKEITEAAIAKFGFQPSAAQLKLLANRQTFALNALVNAKKISDSGAGRDRRFFK
jgi:hypothetical protein